MREQTCPGWCTGVQCREPNPADCFHQCEVSLPMVLRTYDPQRGIADAVAVDGTVALFTSASEGDETWLAIAPGEHGRGLSLSLESARRLARALDELLALAEA